MYNLEPSGETDICQVPIIIIIKCTLVYKYKTNLFKFVTTNIGIHYNYYLI